MEQRLKRESEFYRSEYNAGPGNAVLLDPQREDNRSPADQQRMRDSIHAFRYLQDLERARFLTNFQHFYLRSQVEMRKETVAARKAFHEARRQYHLADREKAIQIYEAPGALPYWRELLENDEFGNDSGIEEDSYIFQIRYLRCIHELYDPQYKQLFAMQAILGEAAATPAPSCLALDQLLRPNLLPDPSVAGPFEGNTKERLDADGNKVPGRPLISEGTINSVNQRNGLGIKRAAPPVQPAEPARPTRPDRP
jgi:hypothetical protein